MNVKGLHTSVARIVSCGWFEFDNEEMRFGARAPRPRADTPPSVFLALMTTAR